MACICPPLTEGSPAKGWNAECPEHGKDSAWYNDTGRAEMYRAAAERLRATPEEEAAIYADTQAWEL